MYYLTNFNHINTSIIVMNDNKQNLDPQSKDDWSALLADTCAQLPSPDKVFLSRELLNAIGHVSVAIRDMNALNADLSERCPMEAVGEDLEIDGIVESACVVRDRMMELMRRLAVCVWLDADGNVC